MYLVTGGVTAVVMLKCVVVLEVGASVVRAFASTAREDMSFKTARIQPRFSPDSAQIRDTSDRDETRTVVRS